MSVAGETQSTRPEPGHEAKLDRHLECNIVGCRIVFRRRPRRRAYRGSRRVGRGRAGCRALAKHHIERLMRLPRTVTLLAFFLFALAPAKANDADIASAFQHLVDGEFAKAHMIAEPLAETGDADALHFMGYLYETGAGVEQNIPRAIEFYKKASDQGQPDAQFSLGELSFSGIGVRQDPEVAAGWFRLAARQGHPRAALRLGLIYAQGLGVEKNARTALDFFESAGDAGDPDGQFNAGVAYLTGAGVRKNYTKAAEWFERAALQGQADAQYNLALVLDAGLAGDADPETAARWLKAAAESGLPAAMVAVGFMIHSGEIDGDGASAPDWFERAADAGDPQGMFLYAVALSEGDDREKDIAAAAMLAEKVLAMEGKVDPVLIRDARTLRARLGDASPARIAAKPVLRSGPESLQKPAPALRD